VFDNQSTDMPSGVIRSFDPVSGRLQWAWDMGVPDRIGPPAPGQTYTRSTPNSWTIFAADETLNLVYVPTGNASPDFWGAKRRPFDEKYGSSIVALDVQTGRPRWSFQTVHHDLWDYDLPAQPSLLDLPTANGPVPALVQATKRGDIYVLDRRTGEPIVGIAERAVPQGPSPGDWVSKTQPFSQLTLPTPELTEASMWGATPFDQLDGRIKFRRSRYEGIFTPPGLKPTIIMPGLTGAVNWGGVAIDVERKVLVANYMTMPWRGNLAPRSEMTKAEAASPWTQRMSGTPYFWRQSPWLGVFDVPCSEPPWGTLVAIDLGTHKAIWSEPLGTGRDSGPFGIASGISLPMGVPSMGGTVVTRSGLVFISGTLDRYLRAFDLGTGRELWKTRLPAGGQATPITYMSGGRQFIVVTAGGHSIMGTKFGDYTIAYSLPVE
jgi:quinoprotein glucose dehydrogenase